MKKHISKSVQRIFALLLCVAMLLTFVPARISVAAAETDSHRVTTSEINKIRNMYPGGSMSNTLEYDCGNGVSGGGERSYLTVITGTNATHFNTFKTNLKNAGYTEKGTRSVASNSTTDNVFASYVAPDGSYKLYTYHYPVYGETRIIVDTQKDTVEGFLYEPQAGVVVEPKLVLWGLSMASNGYGATETVNGTNKNQRNCGAFVVIRMSDNSLFIHDGGDVEQMSDEACDELLAFLRELTGTEPGEKMVINTWFLSHAHHDHFRGFTRFINKNHEHFDVKNVMYNIDEERSGVTWDISGVMQMIRGYYPDVRYYKPHTGESISIADVTFDVVYTLEDRYVPADGTLVTDTENVGGTYRESMYKNVTNKTSDFNDTCTVLRVNFSNGVDALLYADMTRANTMLQEVYPTSALKTDIMMIPHHGHNNQTALVHAADAKVYLYTQHKTAAYGPDNDITTLDMYGTYRESVRDNFIAMFTDKGMYVPAGTEQVDFNIFWAGTESAIIDIVKLGKTLSGASTEPYYTTRPAMNYEYTGWGMMDLSSAVVDPDMLLSAVNQESIEGKKLSTSSLRYEKVGKGELQDNKRYIIMHKSSQNIMSYDPLCVSSGRPNQGTSLVPVSQEALDSENTNVYYMHTNGHVYLHHHNRNQAMWILNQESNSSTALVKSTYKTALFGGTHYSEVWLCKGTKDEYDANGNRVESHNGNYWYALAGQDENSPVTQYRYLDPRYPDERWVKTSVPTGDDATTPKRRYTIEDLGNGDFLVYWRSASGDTVSFLTCDENGVWGVRQYTNSTTDYYPAVPKAGSAELESLKLNFYIYKVLSGTNDYKTVSFDGYRTFNMKQGVTEAQVLSYIQQNIVLRDTNRWNMHVPCNSTTPKVGYYHLKFDKTFVSGGTENAQYKVSVMYRNDNHTDVTITTLTVNVGYEVDDSGNTVQCPHESHDVSGICERCGEAVSHSYKAVKTNPECTKEGYTTHTCSVCGHSYRDSVVEALGHAYLEDVTLPTCVTEGFTVFTCTRCGQSQIGNHVPATGHKWIGASCTEAMCCEECGTTEGAPLGHVYKAVVTPPTCTDGGFTTYTCTSCGYSYTDHATAASGHKYVDEVVAAGCLTDGYTLHTCSACGYSYKDSFQNAAGHTWTSASCTESAQCTVCGATRGDAQGHDYKTEVTPPTCTTGGYTTYTCTVCGHSYQGDQKPAQGHNYQDSVVAPGCTTDGYTLHTCSFCGHNYKDDFQYATGHAWVAASCTEAACCSTCGQTRGEALGHRYESKVVAPQCMKDGYTLHTCSRCGDSYKTDYTAATGHSWKVATCTAPMTCSTCGETVGSALGHSHKAVITEPTCQDRGYTTYTCLTCGDSYVSDYVNATGHSYVDGICTNCGAADASGVTDPGLAVDYPSVSFESEILYNIYFTVENMTDVVEMGLVTFETRNANGTISDALHVYPGYSGSDGSYMAQTEGISAKNLGDAVYFKVYAKLSDGSYVYTDVAGYHAVAYAKSILKNSSNSYMKSLVVAMVNYGAEAQKYFHHNEDSLMNSFLTDAQKALVTDYRASMINGVVAVDSTKAGSLQYNGSSYAKRVPTVSFDGAFAINYYFTTAVKPDSAVKLYYWTLEDYNAATTLSPKNATGSMTMTLTEDANRYWGQISGIAAKELDETVFVVGAYSYNGTTYSTGVLNYHIGKYCAGLAAKDTSDQQDLAKATAVYGYYAKEYFANL